MITFLLNDLQKNFEMVTESVLLICLKPEESAHIQRLLSSFEIEVASSDVCHPDEAGQALTDTNICLVVFCVDEERKRPEQEIRRIRSMLSRPVPILLLIPQEMTSEVRHYIRAGADDYWVLPLDDTAFPVRFYVLLESGQAIAQAAVSGEQRKKQEHENDTAPYKNVLWQRILGRVQEGLRFFSSRSLIQSRKKTPIFHKWEQVRRLGFGGFGEVWLIRERGKERLAVAKIPHSPKMNIKSLRAAAILKRLASHPNADHLIEVVKEEGKIILIQEYVPGPTMQELLESGMDAAPKEKAFLQLLAVVAYAHQHKIMHRDIKPENIIITPSGDLKLLDFGVAKDLSRQSIGTTVVGSRPFMAPEQILGKSGVASDVWSLGVMLYLLSTKTLPFYDNSEKYLMDMILETRPVEPRRMEPGLPEKLEAVILKSLEKDLKRRYANAGELRADLLKACPDFGKGKILPDG
ncbi:serine/threonine-protein kinase [Desulfobacterales bacterium HSG2]|nr:serine/threonine-protein kinase [Desulfobacterales bacterium HSG2]